MTAPLNQPSTVGWVLSGNEHIPGARINGLNLHRQLLRIGVRSVVLRQPEGYAEELLPGENDGILERCRSEGITSVILQKVNGAGAARLVRGAQRAGITTAFIACDTVDNTLAAECDAVFAVSGYLKSMFARSVRSRVHVLDDAIEVPERFKESPIEIPEAGRLRAVFLSSTPPDQNITRLLDICAESVDVTIISSREASAPTPAVVERTPAAAPQSFAQKVQDAVTRHGVGVVPRAYRRLRYKMTARPIAALAPPAAHRFVEWSLASVYDVVAGHHVGLIPIDLDSDFKMAKSANRLGTLMALGMPAIVSPLPAYLEHVAASQAAIVAATAEEWRAAIRLLDTDRARARQIGLKAHRYAWDRFAVDAITRQLLDMLGRTTAARQ